MKEEFAWQLDSKKQATFKRRWLVLIVVVVVIGIFVMSGYLWLENKINDPVVAEDDSFVEVVITEGWGTEAISEELGRLEVISSSLAFKYYVWSSKQQANFKPGKFTLSPGMNIPQIVSLLTDDRSGEVEVTTIEGWDNTEIAKTVSERFATTSFEISLPVRYQEQIELNFKEALREKYNFDFLSGLPDDSNLEGFLFPDTYRFYRSASMHEVVEEMLQNFADKVDDTKRQEIKDRGWTLYEAITLASIVQKEAREEDMPKVAGIFIARLKSGQRLESDATVNYVTKKDLLQPSYEDLDTDSPYNTYRNKGLPPGPICNPGLAAIEAVINPEITSHRYFLNTPDGATMFSDTYEEHLEKKREYLD